MINLPEKKSLKWINLIAIIMTLNLAGLLLSRVLIGQVPTFQNILAFVILSCVISVFYIPGYLGFQTYAFAVIVGDSVGMLYLFYQIVSRRNDGWIDLTSIFSFLTMFAIGVATGIVAQIIVNLLPKTQKNNDANIS